MTEHKQTLGDPRDFETLVRIMARLRAPDGCPWDRKQNFATIKDYFIEEVHEALDAIADGNALKMQEEFGDVLFEIVFLCQLAKDEGLFEIHDSLEMVCTKLIRRHPHVFGDSQVADAQAVRDQWEQVKRKERDEDGEGFRSALAGIPHSLPPLLQALRVSERAVALGFEWPDNKGVMEQLHSEVRELEEAMAEDDLDAIEDELGDVLFTVVNVARRYKLRAHDALLRSTGKFRKRFAMMEEALNEQSIAPNMLNLEQWDEAWKAAKRREAETKTGNTSDKERP